MEWTMNIAIVVQVCMLHISSKVIMRMLPMVRQAVMSCTHVLHHAARTRAVLLVHKQTTVSHVLSLTWGVLTVKLPCHCHRCQQEHHLGSPCLLCRQPMVMPHPLRRPRILCLLSQLRMDLGWLLCQVLLRHR